MAAQEHMANGFLLVYSDVLFDSNILERLLHSDNDIVLAVDHSYTYHKHLIDKKLDLVVSRKHYDMHYRSLHPVGPIELVRIGKEIDIDRADYEFIGIAYFSKRGAYMLREAYEDYLNNPNEEFHEATAPFQASITDLIQELIDRGFPVHGMEVSKGWIEIHSLKDVQVAEAEISELS
jgi:phosphoenolpyruvate phosphomutase